MLLWSSVAVRLAPQAIGDQGIALSPEGRRLFGAMSVEARLNALVRAHQLDVHDVCAGLTCVRSLDASHVFVWRRDTPRPTTALVCLLSDLAPWADRATTFEIEAVRAARSGGRGSLPAHRPERDLAAARRLRRRLVLDAGQHRIAVTLRSTDHVC